MNDKKHIISSTNNLLPTEIEGFDSLTELALDIRSLWNHAADEVWRQLDPVLWEHTHNPWKVLQRASREKIKQLLGDPVFHKKVNEIIVARKHTDTEPAWFQQNHPEVPLTTIAYFSMEFMLGESLPIYSGGLGNVAGDQLKAASDLGVPVVGVGLLYQHGYFHQVIDKEGAQQALFPINDPAKLPITAVRRANGELLRFELAVPGFSVWLRAWEVRVGRTKLYLLDSNDDANSVDYKEITGELYGGGPELRLQQELVLGIGGYQLLGELGVKPEICHLNEGHAAFAVLERARIFMQESSQLFSGAVAITRAGNIFTTHTAVAAGFDRFDPALIERYLGVYAERKLGIPFHDLLALGRLNPDDSSESFNMAYLSIRGSGSVNGVSRLHGQVSRKIFGPLFPNWPIDEVPVGYVTNGVHVPSWDSAAADALWTEVCGEDRWLGTMEFMEEKVRSIPDDRLWKFRTDARKSLIEYTCARLSKESAVTGASPESIDKIKQSFSPDVLTICFARRFATYKRPDLLLHDPERLIRLLTNPERPLQLIIAGKAHPADKEGQALIREWIRFIRRPEVSPHAVFLSDYDMLLAERLVQGADIWLNTPRRPWEASGTSGMKVLVNGGINLSELDGWWSEAYTPEVGWALGDGLEHGDDPARDAVEAEQLYHILESEAVPEFYERDSGGIPKSWIKRIRESMARLSPAFSANRAVREYTTQHYVPAATAYHSRIAGRGALGVQILAWQKRVKEKWAGVRFGEVKIETRNEQHLFEVRVFLNGLDIEKVWVELYADGSDNGVPLRQTMKRKGKSIDASNGYIYKAAVSVSHPATDYTARILPHFDGIAVPLEETRILWQR